MNEQHIFPPATAQETFFCIRQIYDDACPVDVSCAVRNVHEKHWIWTTRLALCIFELAHDFLVFSRNMLQLLQLTYLYQFDHVLFHF